jgi:hypothetical protein
MQVIFALSYLIKKRYTKGTTVFEIVFHRMKHQRTLLDYDEQTKSHKEAQL